VSTGLGVDYWSCSPRSIKTRFLQRKKKDKTRLHRPQIPTFINNCLVWSNGRHQRLGKGNNTVIDLSFSNKPDMDEDAWSGTTFQIIPRRVLSPGSLPTCSLFSPVGLAPFS